MHINELTISNFRNLSHAKLEVGNSSTVVLYGENGSGKTNVLEALALLTPGRGLHKFPAEQHIQQGENSWGIFAQAQNNEDKFTVGQEFRSGKRTIKVDGDAIETQSDLAHFGHLLWFTPKMDRLFMDGTTGRREFLDRLVYGHTPEHAKILAQYKHQLKSRLSLLKRNGDNDWIAVHEEQAAKLAEQIWRNRQNFIDDITPHLDHVVLKLDSTMDQAMQEGGDYFTILDQFTRNRERDRQYGSTHFGPQRSNLIGQYQTRGDDVPMDLANTSTGQHKRAVLNILLANARLTRNQTGQPPAILLDEVTSHLDRTIRKEVFTEMTSLGTQLWLTGTEKELFNDIPGETAFFKVQNGEISEG